MAVEKQPIYHATLFPETRDSVGEISPRSPSKKKFCLVRGQELSLEKIFFPEIPRSSPGESLELRQRSGALIELEDDGVAHHRELCLAGQRARFERFPLTQIPTCKRVPIKMP